MFRLFKTKSMFRLLFRVLINNKMARKRAFFFVILCSILDAGELVS